MRLNQFTSVFLGLVASVSAFVAPQVTAAARLEQRQASVCGYYSKSDTVSPITCENGLDCGIATDLSPAMGYCGETPGTYVYDYGYWPLEGCNNSEVCCPSTSPSALKWEFDGGSTVFLGCGSMHTTYSGFFSDISYTPGDASPTGTLGGGSKLTPVDNGVSSPTTSSDGGSLSSTNSRELSVGAKAGIGIACGIGFILIGVFVWIKRRWLKSKLNGHPHQTSPPQPQVNNFPTNLQYDQQNSQPPMSSPLVKTAYYQDPNMFKAPTPVVSEPTSTGNTN